MSDPYAGVTRPNPERERLVRSVFRPSPLEGVAEAISVATESFHDIYVERRGDQYRWSFATKGGPYPLLRITAKYFQVDYLSIIVGFRQVGDGWCVQIVEETDGEPDAWAVLRFDELTRADQVGVRVLTELEKDGAPR
jgi:hypothetical protein